jgi:hypothetical protein
MRSQRPTGRRLCFCGGKRHRLIKNPFTSNWLQVFRRADAGSSAQIEGNRIRRERYAKKCRGSEPA